MLDKPCIEVSQVDARPMTVAAYDAVLNQFYDQPLWARTATPVYKLTTQPEACWGAHVIDIEAYEAQMWRLLGLEVTQSDRLGGGA